MGKQGKRSRSVFIQSGTDYYVLADGKTFVDKDGYPVSKPVKAEDDKIISQVNKTTPKAKKTSHKIGKLVSKVVSTLRCGKEWRLYTGVKQLIRLKNNTKVRFGKNTRNTFEMYDHTNTYTQA